RVVLEHLSPVSAVVRVHDEHRIAVLGEARRHIARGLTPISRCPRSAQETGSDPDFTILVAEAEREERAAGRDRHVLAAVDGIGHRTRVDLSPERLPPQELARARVEREEVALASAAAYEAAPRRQHAAPRDAGHAAPPD